MASTARRRDRRSQPAAGAAHPARPRPNRTSSLALRPLHFVLFATVAAPAAFLLTRRSSESLPAVATVATVYERGLVKADISYHEILQEHEKAAADQSKRRFTGPVLAYVTPWNAKGYEMAKKFNSKFSHISPVWYELKSEGQKLTLEGRHNVDIGWLSWLQTNGTSLVVPRIVLEANPANFLLEKQQCAKAISLIVNECKEFGYDGIVLESWSRWAMYGVLQNANLRSVALQFIEQLGEALHSVSLRSYVGDHLKLIYVIPATRTEKLDAYDFGPEDLRALSNVVDGFSLMTYDFSGPQNPGPNAPLNWIRSTLHLLLPDKNSTRNDLRSKVFVGINFYGNDFALGGGYGGGAILGRDYISLLKKHKPSLLWEEKSYEHYFVYSLNGIRHAVFYPSLMSISVRVHEALDWGTGLAIWEIGQGLNYFFDLL